MLRVGIDLVKVASVREAIEEHGQRYLDRVFTAGEQERCKGQALRLAARLAAKEATMKVLQPRAADPLPWTDIEVVRPAGDASPAIALHRRAAELADRAGITALSLSFTHEDEYAAAVVVGT
jgi:holo-[acyl-carrier protein] synthase